MMRFAPVVVCCALVYLTSTSCAQEPQSVPPVLTFEEPATVTEPAPEAETSRLPSFRQLKLQYTDIGAHERSSLPMQDVELSTTWAMPWCPGLTPLQLTPTAAVHTWQARHSTWLDPKVPSQLYDLALDIGWKERLAPWFFMDLGVTPGLYTDFREVDAASFRPQGRGLGIIAFSEQLQLVAGVLYVNRNQVKVLPAGGLVWNPSADTRCQLVFPSPKISHRFATCGQCALWGYLAGEFGGGAWSYERSDGAPDLVDYRDARLLAGIEWDTPAHIKAHLELGWAVGRQITFGSPTPSLDLPAAVVLRAALRF